MQEYVSGTGSRCPTFSLIVILNIHAGWLMEAGPMSTINVESSLLQRWTYGILQNPAVKSDQRATLMVAIRSTADSRLGPQSSKTSNTSRRPLLLTGGPSRAAVRYPPGAYTPHQHWGSCGAGSGTSRCPLDPTRGAHCHSPDWEEAGEAELLAGVVVVAAAAGCTQAAAQVEALKRQLQESAKVAQGAQSLPVNIPPPLQEQLQHVQAEAQELQRKHREASIRLQEERSRGETAERERKEAHDKCLLLEAELHKARQQQQQERGAAGGAAVAPVLAATGGSPSTTTSAAAATPSPALLLTALDGLRAARLPLWQRLWCTCPDSLAVLLHPTAPATAAAAAAGEEEEEEEDGGSRGTAAAAAPCLAAGLMPLPGLHHTYQHRHVVLGGGSSSQLGPPGQMCPALLGGSLTGGGAGGGDGGDSDGGGSGSDHRTAVRGRCVALVEGVRVQLRALAGGRGDGTAVLLGVVAVLQAATGTCSEADAVAGGDGGGDRYRGSVPGSAASGGGPLQPPGEEAAAAGGDDTQPPHGGGGGGGEGGHDDEGPQGGDLGQSPQRRLEVGVGVEAAKVVARQRAALWPLVGPCVELLGGLLAHSEECRAAVGAATVESGGCGSAEASAPRPPPALPGEATTTTATAAATAVMTSSGASSHCVGGPLRWGSLPYLLLPLTGSHGCVAAAAAARAERRRHVRRFVYGSSSSSSQNGCLGASFDPGGSTAAYATLNANAQAAGGGQERPMGQQHEPKAALTTLAADGADPLIRGEGEEHGPGAAGRCDAVGGAAAAISAPLRDLVRLLMAVAACCNAEDDGGAEIAPAGPCSGAGGVVPHVDVLRCVAGALSSLGAVLPAASTRRALLPALLDPLHLLVPLMCRTATHTRLAATALLRLMMENPDCAAAAATALGVTGYTATAATTATTDNRASGPDAHHNRSSAPPSHDKVLEPAAAVQLFTALLDALDPESGCGEEGPGGWGRSEAAAGEQGWAGGSGSGWGGPPGASSPYDLPRQVLALLALLLDTGHEGLGYGLPLRLLALADTACKPPGSEDPLEPVYPAPADPSLEIVAGSCVPPADWLQVLSVVLRCVVWVSGGEVEVDVERLRAAQEALVLLKELLTGGSEDTRRAALDGLAPSSPDSDSPQLVELATSRLGAWARTPPELLQAALGPEAGFGAPVLAPWAARLVLSGGSGGAGRTGGVAGRGAGCNGVGGAGLVVCSVEAVGALAGSVRRRWEHWQLKQHQVWQQFNQQQLRQR
ncbi:hypothetical protein VOLCADRAFT_107834 [Volvox carteri f. nagariensis]|uniref:Uncharacterized protein n=1 Tax=Volvox carteri f. nagariensis TaxID=3068 RepID=D8UGR5_VOLCA|nr:uncharacterized protein VOLCADRAFT_107834 [Volvox carteri f. nagariensis]EFJ41096.1 hypothetical protein VOLCADRAFT_107834 [Volvox carteri f. nagariensis]|eukprot:XP_002957859.1 hypothetical protein VOLCADRAFT_107834 [Volvox carteri f. nagariensis]